MKVLVAMSGGVDSSVAAARMVADGHDVTGVTLKLWAGPNGEMPTAGCCTVSDSEDARRVAAQLDIPYYVLDYTEDFSRGVIDGFVSDYLSGRTPNPCVECNRTVKFSRLLEQAAEFGCETVVTGHYARVDRHGGRYRLRRGVDSAKDQSYVLSMLGQDQLARVRFPVGDLEKHQVRRIAADLGLRTARKPESMDICFVGRGDYRAFLRDEAPEALEPGAVMTTDGRQVGTHEGVAGFTVGQRRGLGVALGEPHFVVGVDAPNRTVTIGTREHLATRSIALDHIAWTHRPLAGAEQVLVQYRAHGDATEAVWDGEATVTFLQPQVAVAPGQTAAFYRGDEVLGGGIIVSA
ncbi:MAG TPA: tRNA 2-thiouridine(34) synthase MnmA [Acidimicrobiia bacterium]|nr:tRNA 2-thiouridine(34) synthase MnmA [Acidimicrobiia bacterium]